MAPVVFNCGQLLKVRADRRKNDRLRKYHYSEIQNAGDCVARTGVREIGFKVGSLPHDPGGITCMQNLNVDCTIYYDETNIQEQKHNMSHDM